jgi:hypothetical protein
MGDLLVAGTNSTIVDLSSRAIFGATVTLFVLLLLNALFKKNAEVKKYLFVLTIAVILFATTVLLVTALVNIQDTIASLWPGLWL